MSVSLNYSPTFFKIIRNGKVISEKVRGFRHKTSIEIGLKTDIQVGDIIENIVDHSQIEAMEITMQNNKQGRVECFLVYVKFLSENQ
jgi:hypothetical protein